MTLIKTIRAAKLRRGDMIKLDTDLIGLIKSAEVQKNIVKLYITLNNSKLTFPFQFLKNKKVVKVN